MKKILKLSCLIIYIALSITLIIESCITGDSSTNQSNAVGGTIANVFNDISGDQSKKIEPTKLTIDNKNEINNVFVYDSYSLKTTLEPNNTTFTSLIYSSSDEEIAKVDNTGKINFLKKGKVKIEVKNKEYLNVFDNIEINVNEVIATKFETNIKNAKFDNELNAYILETSSIYNLINEFSPNNTTDKNVNYILDNNEYLKIENNYIIPLKHSYNQITKLKIIHGDLINELNIIVKEPYIIDINDFNVNDEEIYVDQILTPIISFNPSYPTYIDYSLSSTSNNIEIIDNKIKGLKPSNNNIITLKLNKYNLSKDFNITVKEKEKISNIDPLIPYLVKGVKNQIYLNPDKKYYDNDFIYKSNDESIIEINNNIVIPKNIGKTSIIISNSLINKEIEVEVHSPLENFDYNLDNTLNIPLNNSLNSLIEFNNNIAYYIENNNYIKEIDNNYKFNKIGKYNLIYVNKHTGVISKTEINCYEDYLIEDININLKEKQIIKFDTIYQDYSFITPSSIIINKLNKNEFEFISLDKGNYNISINALINDEILFTKSININVLETSLTNNNLLLGCNLINQNDYIALDNPTKFTLSPLANYYIKPFAYSILDQDLFNQNLSKIDKEELTNIRNKEIDINKINNTNIVVISSDENIIKITKINDKYKINPLGIGKTKIIIEDKISSLTKEIEIGIYNYVRLDQEPYTLSGNDITKIKDNNYSVINNSSINLKININTAASSYFTINYTSSDENVAKIGLDGNISFFKTGEVIIHVTCYDGKSPKYLYSLSTGEKILNYVDYEIVFEIKPKLLITDLNSFFLKVRKSIGHFGAFLVLGIFSSLTYLLYFNSKKWKVTLPINYLQGIGLAFLTEFIQLFVPGRVGSLTDVLIDSTGFIISSTIIIIIFIIITFKKKQK